MRHPSVRLAGRLYAWQFVLALLVAHPAPAFAARLVYLFYPGGETPIPGGFTCRGLNTPPAYRCAFADTIEACQQEIQGFLDRFYAPFDIEFTTTLPAQAPYYTIVVTAGWSSCASDVNVNGMTQQTCRDVNGNVAYVFACGESAKRCA